MDGALTFMNALHFSSLRFCIILNVRYCLTLINRWTDDFGRAKDILPCLIAMGFFSYITIAGDCEDAC